MLKQLRNLSRHNKAFLMMLCDFTLLPLAFWSAIAIRLGTFYPSISEFYILFLILPILTIPVFYALGLYRAVIRHANDRIIYLVLSGVGISVLIITAVVVFFRFSGIPRSSLIIYGVLASFYIIGSRFFARTLLSSIQYRKSKREKVAIYGAGQAGTQTALALFSGKEFEPIAFIDDNNGLIGRSILGVRVYAPSQAMDILKKKNCEQLLLAMPSASRSRKKDIIKNFEGKGLILKTIPGIGDLVDGKVRVEDIREVGIEDLLGRDPVPAIDELLSVCIFDKNVMVTGAGGSIGSELCRQILKQTPKNLILFEMSEYNLYKIEKELSKIKSNTKIIPILGDVKNNDILKNVILKNSINTIYHAAAYKHVPLVESNVIAGILNNVFGTLQLTEVAVNSSVETLVLISTDKAVRPTNVMGATKRLAEMILQAYSENKTNTKLCMVRFGNVLGSSGSVIPLFKEQIKNGGPVTITHPDVTRYFMTIPEASELVIQASAMGLGGDVFVLDMGESVKIIDLARRLIEFSGLKEIDSTSGQGDIAIRIVGLRPGEKLYEELLIGSNVGKTSHPRIMKAREEHLPLNKILKDLEDLKTSCIHGKLDECFKILKKLVPEWERQN